MEKRDLKKIEDAFFAFGPTWPKWIGSSRPQALEVWKQLDDAERQRAAELGQEYVRQFLASGFTKSGICALQVYLKEKRWEQIERPEPERKVPDLVKPYGKLWSAMRLHHLAQPRRPWRMKPWQEKAVAENPSLAAAFTADRHRAEFPAVAELDRHAEEGRSLPPPDGAARFDLTGYAQVRAGSPEWDEWQVWLEAHDVPPMPMPPGVERGAERYVWLPVEKPDWTVVPSQLTYVDGDNGEAEHECL